MKFYILILCFATGVGGSFAEELPHWTYSGSAGPDAWATLCPEFSDCAGLNQSPVNLTGFVEAELTPVTINYQAGGSEILNNGHTIQVNYAAGSSINLDGITFALKQFHFHSPSENLIEGKSFAMEMHLVHSDTDGNLAVIAIMFNEGTENEALAEIWQLMPAKAGDKSSLTALFAAIELLPQNRDFYRFNGSLTTPPCTEGVRWVVMKTPVAASQDQFAAFTGVMQHPNNRPVQAINARLILK